MAAIPSILIDADGSLHTLYNEEIDLQELGRVENVHRASHIRHDPDAQEFRVIDAYTDEEVFRHPSRKTCVDWEIRHFGPGGMHYHGSETNQD